MTHWRDLLQPASFRGVPFHVESESSPVGRKTQVHEFVQRDKPFVEDMGRKTREFKVTAFVVGADYFQQRDALLDALDKPGPGELSHPWLGKMTVTAGDCTLSHEQREGGVARLDLVFIESGDKGFPVGTANTSKQLLRAKEGLWDTDKGKFSQAMAKVNLARTKMTALRSALMAPFDAARSQLGEVMRGVGSVTGFANSLVASPASFLGLFGSLGSGVSGLGGFSGFGGFSAALQSLRGKSSAVQSLGSYPPAGGDTARAASATQRLVRDALLVQIAEEAAAIPALPAPPAPPATPSVEQQVVQPVARDEVPVTDDVLATRDAVNEAFWSAAMDADHEQFEKLEAVRKAVYSHLTAVAAAGVRLVEVVPRTTEPALVLAYRRYGDATRAAEIVTRNRIRHPGFIAPTALQVAKE